MFIPGKRGPDPTLLSHSWHVLSCRYLALTAVEIFVLFLEKRWKQLRQAEKISKSTQYTCRVTQQRGGRGGRRRRRRADSYQELKVSVNLDCHAGNARRSFHPSAAFHQKGGKEEKMLQRLYVNSVYFSHAYKSAEGAYGFTLQLITSHAVRWERQHTPVTRSSSQWQQQRPRCRLLSVKCMLVWHHEMLSSARLLFFCQLMSKGLWKLASAVRFSLSPSEGKRAARRATSDNNQRGNKQMDLEN